MSDYKGLRWIRGRQDATRQMYEEITPSSGWTQDPNSHYLLVDLPGFKRSDVKLQIDKSGTIAVSGERLAGLGKHIHFQKAFKVPEDVDTEKITMKFEGKTLKVSIPKVAKDQNQEEQEESKNGASSSESREVRKKEEEPENPDDENNGQETEENVEEHNRSYPEEENNLDLDQRKQISEEGKGNKSQKSVIRKISENKGIIMIALLSFTLGLLVSQKLHSPHVK